MRELNVYQDANLGAMYQDLLNHRNITSKKQNRPSKILTLKYSGGAKSYILNK